MRRHLKYLIDPANILHHQFMRQNIAFALNGFNDDMNSVQIYTVLSKPEILNNNIFYKNNYCLIKIHTCKWQRTRRQLKKSKR